MGILCFGLGMVLQAALMLRGALRPGDLIRAGKAFLLATLGMIPERREHQYQPAFHVFLSLTLLGGAFAYLFRDRLLSRIGGRLLLAWNMVLIDVTLLAGWNSPVSLMLLAVPTIPTVVNAFTDIDRFPAWKVFFHAWFSTILVVLAIVGFDAGQLRVFLDRSGSAPAPSPLEAMVSGAAYLYIITNAWFVLALVPIPLRRDQPWRERMEEIRRHASLLARGYVWEKDDPLRSLAVLVGLPVLLFAAARWGAGDRGAIVPLAVALMPLLAGRTADAEPEEPSTEPTRPVTRGRQKPSAPVRHRR